MLKSSFFDRPDIQTHTLDKNLALWLLPNIVTLPIDLLIIHGD